MFEAKFSEFARAFFYELGDTNLFFSSERAASRTSLPATRLADRARSTPSLPSLVRRSESSSWMEMSLSIATRALFMNIFVLFGSVIYREVLV